MSRRDDSPGEHSYGAQAPYTLGVEEELFLVDPVAGEQINASDAVLERVGELDGTVERELHASQVELITSISERVVEAASALASMRRAVTATGAGLLGAGTHPSAEEGAAEITDKERYERIHELLGDAVATAVSGLHIHVGMPDPETAIRAFNGLRRRLPLLQALGANSPFRHGRDTGLASAREVTVRGWPRSGVPRAMRDFEDFVAATGVLVRAADVADYTWFWWKLRPHPRLGTVEIRALDTQTTVADTAGLVALAHCLARDAALGGGEAPDPPADVLEEGIFRAARYGVQARLPDADGTLRTVGELLDEALGAAREHAQDLGCTAELESVGELYGNGGGAGRQREIYEVAGMSALLRRLTELSDGSD
jgi:carboxylate-amine ligase